MEGVGSRLGRASSRYGPSATATVFNGPVRKWRKKWVHVSPSSTVSHHNSHSQSNGHTNNNSRLLLCRWTPLSPSPATAADTSSSEEPPKRKFRYTPIAVLEERMKTAKMVDHEAKVGSINQFTTLQTAKSDELNSDTSLKTETQDSNASNLDLGLCLKGHNGEDNNHGQSKEGQMKKASSGGFWKTG
ncbi:uncharacterized protein LOC110610299 [Manihot esculenta]|uniref:Uncharacterized protein n=1 Tax=Manihot esculenta TaxID=3983 RepID=A0A2C9W791_MANES|nr:uncharacterized protein LOC110610299 [Manihot esculenta]OAY55212.1 hypothetical protein MANES_03G136700v8 [Manihot esculenta]